MPKLVRNGLVLAIVVVVAVAALTGAYLLSAPGGACSGVATGTSPPATNASVATRTVAAGPAAPRVTTGIPVGSSIVPPPEAAHALTTPPIVINVVAAENFWGSLVAQLGGAHVNVTSVVNDPNFDPHEYQSNDSTAIAFHDAQYVILNNVGYDDWANLLLAADGATNQTILNVGDSLGVHAGGGIVSGNPHLWYDPQYVRATVTWIYQNLSAIAPSLTGYFTAQYDNVTASLTTLYNEVALIHQSFPGVEVAATEDIFVYLANATGLDLVSPPSFMEAVAEGNEPPAHSVVLFECQLESGHVRVLVYNAQTVSATTTTMKQIAQEHNVTVMSVTETIVPPSESFQAWMGGELNELYVALDANALGA